MRMETGRGRLGREGGVEVGVRVRIRMGMEMGMGRRLNEDEDGIGN